MRELFYPKISRPDRRDDCFILMEQLRVAGYNCNLKDICDAWEEYSDSMCAGWMMVDKSDDTNIIHILHYLREKDWSDD